MQIELFPVGISYGIRTTIPVFLVVKDKDCYVIGNEGLGAWHADLWQLSRESFRRHYEKLFARIDEIRKEKHLAEPVILSSEKHGGGYVINLFSEAFLDELRNEAEKYLKETGHWEENVMSWRERALAKALEIL